MRRRDGVIRDMLVRISKVRDPGGAVVGLRGVTEDITDSKRAAAGMAALERQLQQAQKMESVGRLAGGVAHDFNNILSVILGHAELALGQLADGHPVRDDLTEILTAAQRSANLTRQLLAVGRRQVVLPRVLDLNETVGDSLKLLSRLIGEDIRIAWRPAADLWPIKMDPSQVDQVLTNLCVNARDAIADVGTIVLTTANRVIDAAFCNTQPAAVPGEYVQLTVSDDGAGMDGQTLAQIFEPFFTTKAPGDGTGMGLATVYGAVRQNGGFITVQSAPGRGATFEIYLPRFTGRIEPAAPRPPAQPPGHGDETILIVEDEASILRLTARLLRGRGYRVLEASGPDDALRLAAEHDGAIDLLLSDVIMPKMNGRDLAAAVMSRRPSIRYLFMSGYPSNVIAMRGVVEEGVHFLQKPFSHEQLANKVREVLDAT